MDEIDQAQHFEELYRQSALRDHFAGVPSGPAIRPASVKRCCDCGEKIETARLKALPNAVRCIDCQNQKERREKHGFI